MTKNINEQEKYVDIFKQINDNYNIMKALRPIPSSAIKRYREEMDILSSFYSNAIEGNTFTYDETRLLIKEGIATSARSLREHNDIAGHSRAYWSLYESLKNNEQITQDFIFNLHAKVLQGDDYAGKYRDAAVYIGDAITVSYVAPDCDKLPSLVADYVQMVQPEINSSIKELRETEHPNWASLFTTLAKHHVEFERIHPFFDGNGRTGRLLLNYEMISMGLLSFNILPENRARYGSAFEKYDNRAKYSARTESKYERMAKVLAESELKSMEEWNKMFTNYSNS